MKVVIFDSGIGGFSILQELLKLSYPLELVYLADQANFPYGDKSSPWLQQRLAQIASYAASLKPDFFILACNTATVSGVDLVRGVLAVPVIGVEPTVKPLSGLGKSLVLTTPATAKSPRLAKLLAAHGADCQVFSPSGLAAAIESDQEGTINSIIKLLADKIRHEQIQAVGLSCTHYPLIKTQLAQAVGKGVKLVDPSSAVVKRLLHLLPPHNPAGKASVSSLTFITTGRSVRLDQQVKKHLAMKTSAKQIDI